MDPLTTRPIERCWEFTNEPYQSWRFWCIDIPHHHFGNSSFWTRTRTRSDYPEPFPTPDVAVVRYAGRSSGWYCDGKAWCGGIVFCSEGFDACYVDWWRRSSTRCGAPDDTDCKPWMIRWWSQSTLANGKPLVWIPKENAHLIDLE